MDLKEGISDMGDKDLAELVKEIRGWQKYGHYCEDSQLKEIAEYFLDDISPISLNFVAYLVLLEASRRWLAGCVNS